MRRIRLTRPIRREEGPSVGQGVRRALAGLGEQDFAGVMIDDGDPAEGHCLHDPTVDPEVAVLLPEIPAAVGVGRGIQVALPADLDQRAAVLAAAPADMLKGAAHCFTRPLVPTGSSRDSDAVPPIVHVFQFEKE